jgi:3',5'-nucleoside bisphosphate phosphatase
MVDLHCHSTFSDGLLSPSELIARALTANVGLLALTDHDTTSGLNLLHEAAIGSGISIINGIELSTRWKMHDIHVVGLGIDPENAALQRCIAQQAECRTKRAIMMGNLLQPFGISDAYEKALALAGHTRVSRPHFAEVLVQEGLVKETKTAFERYLARGKPAYVVTEWVTLPEVIEIISGAGGVAVLAHPLKYRLTRTKLNALICAFKEAGGLSMEVVSGSMTTHDLIQMAHLCNRHELLASSGSDFHGEPLSRIGLGRQHHLPPDCVPVWERWGVH